MKTFIWLIVVILISLSSAKSLNENSNIQQSNQQIKFPFQRKIWTYWNSANNEVPLVVKICLDNLERVAKKHNFQFVCLNEQNVRDYITNYDQQFIKVRQKSIQKDFAHAADLLRMIILQQQGGIWVDSTTIFLNGLTQLQNIMSPQYNHMIANRFSQQPDALLFYYSLGQNRIQQKIINPNNHSQTILLNEMPNFQIWFIAGKKQSPIIKDIKKTYVQFTTTNFLQVEKKFRNQDIFINRIDDFGHYLYLNMAVAYTLQRKQAELDKDLQLFGERKSVFEEYKLWGLHAEYGPMIMIREDLISLDSLFRYSQQQLKSQGWNFIFFMKQFGYFRYYMGWYLDNLIAAFKDFEGSFSDWLGSKPDGMYCQNLSPIVEGSIFHKMLENSLAFKSTKGLKIVTKQQYTEWQKYCQQHSYLSTKIKKFFKNSIFHTWILRLFMYDKVVRAKVKQILAQNGKQEMGYFDVLNLFYEDNQFFVFDFGYFFIVTWLMFWVYRKVVAKLLQTLKKQKERLSKQFRLQYLMPNFRRPKRLSIFKTVKQINRQKRDNKSRSKSISQRIKLPLLHWLVFAMVLWSLLMYNAVDITGGRQQPYTIFFYIVTVFILQTYIESQIKQNKLNHKKQQIQQQQSWLKLRYEYEFFWLFVNYFIGYMGLVYVRRNRYYLNWCAIVLGCVGPCVVKMARALNKQKQQNLREGKSKSISNTNNRNKKLNPFGRSQYSQLSTSSTYSPKQTSPQQLHSSDQHHHSQPHNEQPQQHSNDTKNNILSDHMIFSLLTYRLIVTITVGVVTFIPNVRYLAYQEQLTSSYSSYYIQYLPIIPILYIFIVYTLIFVKSLLQKLYIEILRLLILAVVLIELTCLVDKIQLLVHLNPRMLFVFRNVIILQAIYIQIGSLNNKIQSSGSKKPVAQNNQPNQTHFNENRSPLDPILSNRLYKLSLLILPFFIQFIFGRFYFNIEHISRLYYDYSQHIVILIYAGLMTGVFIFNQQEVKIVEKQQMRQSQQQMQLSLHERLPFIEDLRKKYNSFEDYMWRKKQKQQF